jgi:hypothetical protein
MTRRPSAAAALVAAVAALSAACGMPLMSLPAGPGGPAPDTAAALADATAACRSVSTFSAEIAVRGSVNGRGVRARLIAGVGGADSIRVEAVAPFGRPLFIVVASGGDATVVLSDDRVLEHGPPAAVLEALTGVPIDADDLRPLLTGCSEAPEPSRGRSLGDLWRTVPDAGAVLYLQREASGAPWRLVAAVHRPAGNDDTWRAEYRDFESGLPHGIRLASAGRKPFDLRLALSQVTLNETLGPEVFQVRVPAGAVPVTLEELRGSGPLSGRR